MPPVDLQLATGSYKSKDGTLSAEQNINLFPVVLQNAGSSPFGLSSSHGIEMWTDTNVGGNGRGWIIFQNEVYAVQGSAFVRITSGKIAIQLGGISGTSQCILAENGESIAIVVPDGPSYFYDKTAGLKQILDPDFLAFGQVTSVVEKDFYFIFTTDTEFFVSSLPDTDKGQDFSNSALDSGTAEVSTDKILRAFTVRDELVILGTDTLEFFRNVPNANFFPFQRITGAHVPKGIKSRLGIVEFDNSYVYLGGNLKERTAIWRGTPGNALKISTDAIDNQIQSYTDAQLQEVDAWTYTLDGYYFAGWNFPDVTLVYNATASALAGTPMWHELQTDGSQWRGRNCLNAYGTTLVQDNSTSKIGELSTSNYTDYGTSQPRTVITKYIQNLGQSIFTSKAELFMKVATTTDPLAFPTVNLSISSDGGRTYKDMGSKSIGRINELETKVKWNRLGKTPYSRNFKLTVTDSAEISLHRLVVDMVS